jgi:hypothetical protein
MPTKIRKPCYQRLPEGQLAKWHFPVVSGIVKDGTSHKLSVKAHVDEPFADARAGALNGARPRAVLWQGQRLC